MAQFTFNARIPTSRGEIEFTLKADNVEVPNEMYRAAGYAALSLAALYGVPYFKSLFEGAIQRVFDAADQGIHSIFPGSLHVVLHCFTAKRFLEVLDEYESGKIQQRLEKEFSDLSIKVTGLTVEIENIKEVKKRKKAIETEKSNLKLKGRWTAHDYSPLEGKVRPRIIVQGGVFRPMDTYLKERYKEATKESARRGYAVLMNGGTAIDAVEAAVRVLESDELFNAGRGSFLNSDGEVECEAMIMEGDKLDNGAVISGKHFLHPVSLARKIMTDSPQCALSGDGALKFAQENNIPHCAPEELIIKKRTPDNPKGHRWKKFPDWEIEIGGNLLIDLLDHDSSILPSAVGDTVSSVAMDSNGTLACATSTGGLARKSKGRVGDAPLIGCGAYANQNGSATCAGVGESIMKVTLARQAVYNMESGQNAQESAENALKKMKDEVNGHGGIIAIDKDGNFGKAFNTSLMVWASTNGETLAFGMEKDESVDEPL